MNRKFLLLASIAMLSVPVAASAAAPEFYIGAGGGINLLHDTNVEGGGINRDIDFDAGWAGVGSVGYHFANGFRTELEIGYRGSNDVDDISATTIEDGDASSWSFMGNVLYQHSNDTPFAPYIGVGAGMVRVNYDNVRSVAGTTIDDSDSTLGVQGIVGMNYSINNNWNLFVDYRYLTAINPELTTNTNVSVDTDYDNSTFLVGLRYGFGAPAAAMPAPAPAPVPVASVPPAEPRNYIVFFNFDRADLTDEAKKIIAEAAQNANRGGVVNIDVTGHADRAGSDMYNQKLSQRRANAVKAEMERLGVKTSEIQTAAKGESDPLVPTDDGVREPQNRRVEINYTIQPQ